MAGEAAKSQRELTAREWQRVKEVLADALELPAGERAAHLDRICRNESDAALRRRVETLIAAHEQAGAAKLDPLGLPTGNSSPASADDNDVRKAAIGLRIGAYRIEAELGHGGMGTVYRAVRADDEFQKQVAIKLVRNASFSPENGERFRHERQILAALEHSNIARLLDGGTTEEGVSFLVMEYIEGTSIARHCDSHRLTIAQRLRLFQKVCLAVHYAHQNLIIHRDIKPQNILVADNGEPKLLDFGIAKMVDAEGKLSSTVSRWIPLTPAYASPEQLLGKPVTTATDIYSLGVVLYELLSGRSPYQHAGASFPLLREILEEDPARPSEALHQVLPTGDNQAETKDRATTAEQIGGMRQASAEQLSRMLRGDLESVIFKAMQKDPARRYASVQQFSEDIERYLEGEPVSAHLSAHPGALGYRMRKLVMRHKTGVAAVVLTMLSLLAGIIGATWQARQARMQKAIAERRLEDARKFAASVLQSISEADYQGPTKMREVASSKIPEYLDALTKEARDDPRLLRDLGLAYGQAARINANPGIPNLGDLAKALENEQKSAQIFERLAAADPGNEDIQELLSYSYMEQGLFWLPTDVSKSLEMHRKSASVMEAFIEKYPHSYRVELDLSTHYELVGERYGHPSYANLGDTSLALEYCERVLKAREDLHKKNPNGRDVSDALADSYDLVGRLRWAIGDSKSALAYMQRGIDLVNTIYVPDAYWIRDIGVRKMYRAGVLEDEGRFREALSNLRSTESLLRPLYDSDQRDLQYTRDLSRTYNQMGSVLLKIGDIQGSVASYRAAAKMNEDFLAHGTDHPEVKERLAVSYEGMGNALSQLGEMRHAMEKSRQALEMHEALANIDPKNAFYAYALGVNYMDFARVMRKNGNLADAREYYRKSAAVFERLSVADPINVVKRKALLKAKQGLSELNSPGQE